ncbi:MAG TPA: hypothetical protein VH395_17180 [Jatrophihabitantaceae bacterium]
MRQFDTDNTEALLTKLHQALDGGWSEVAVRDLLGTTTAAMRGVAMLTFGHEGVEGQWRATRRHLLTMWRDSPGLTQPNRRP